MRLVNILKVMGLLAVTPLVCGVCHSPHVTTYRDTGDFVYPRKIDGVCDTCGAIIGITVVEPPKKKIAV